MTLTVGASQTSDLVLVASADTAVQPPLLGDLGFPPDQSQGNAQDQARLDKRSHMLKMHQRFGLITLAPLVATIATSNLAAGRHSTAIGRDVHGALGSVTADLYFMTAYYAHPRAYDTRNHDARSHPPAQSAGLDSWAGDDPDPILGRWLTLKKTVGKKYMGSPWRIQRWQP